MSRGAGAAPPSPGAARGCDELCATITDSEAVPRPGAAARGFLPGHGPARPAVAGVTRRKRIHIKGVPV